MVGGMKEETSIKVASLNRARQVAAVASIRARLGAVLDETKTAAPYETPDGELWDARMRAYKLLDARKHELIHGTYTGLLR